MPASTRIGPETRRAIAWIILASTLMAALAAGVAPPAAAQPEPPALPGDLKAEVEAAFRVVRLSEGVLLEPRDGDTGVSTVEVGDGILALDGEPVSVAELRERLGGAADLVLRLYDLGGEGARGLFASAPELADEEAEVGVGVAPPPPPPPPPPTRPRRPHRPDAPKVRTDAQVVVGSNLTVERDETARDVVVFGGTLRIDGEVVGDAVVLGGTARVDGSVSGDVAAVGGTVRLGPGAEVGGDVVSVGGRVDSESGAVVHGEIVQVPFGPEFRFDAGRPWTWWQDDHLSWFDFSPWTYGLGIMWKVFGLVVMALLVSLAMLVARGPIERIERKVKGEPWKAGLVGLVTQILSLPLLIVVIVVLAISIIGIPLLLLVPFAVLAAIVVAFIGYTAVLYRLGRWTRDRFGWELPNPYVAALLGLALVEVWGFLGELLGIGGGPIRFFAVMFIVFGCLLAYVVWTVGLGGALLSRFGTAEGWNGGGRRMELPPPPPVPPIGSEPGFAVPPATPEPQEPPAPSDWDDEPLRPEDEPR